MAAVKLMKLYLLISLSIIGVLFSIAFIRTVLIVKPDLLQPCSSEEADFIPNDGLSDRLSQAITYETISYSPENCNKEELKKFANFLERNFPTVHTSPLVKKEIVNEFSLLYSVKGTDPTLKPYMLASHMDVVPVDTEMWDLPPFSGKVEDGFINGRGTIDDKHGVLGILEALEFLLKRNFQPQRSFFLAFGHDEEVGGYDGARHISKLLQSRGITLEYIIDEGSFVMNDSIPGVNVPISLISVSEKGQLTIKLSVDSTPGHSSIPPKETAIVILANAVSRLRGDAFPSMLGSDVDHETFKQLAPYASFPFKFVYANLWLFKPLISWVMSKVQVLNPLVRTTMAVTMISGGLKENVLPSNAFAAVNLRVHSSQTIEEAFDYVKNLVNDDRINMSIMSSKPPHPISPFSATDFGYNTIKNSIRQIFPDCCVVPITLIANTDTIWYWNLTASIYRFNPTNLQPKDVSRFHGHNEKISVDNYVQVVNFFLHLIKNSDEKVLKPPHGHLEEL